MVNNRLTNVSCRLGKITKMNIHARKLYPQLQWFFSNFILHWHFCPIWISHFFYFYSPLLGTVKDGLLTIGNVSAPVYSPDEKMKVPDVLFYENVQVSSLSAHYQKEILSSSLHSMGPQRTMSLASWAALLI